MSILQFLFGRGWWIPWHLAFYLVLLVTVVLTLAVFGQELKGPGEKPDTPSPGSLLVVMIALGLGFVTFANGAVFAHTLAGSWVARALLVVGVAATVALALSPLNLLLATRQNHPTFYANVAASALIVLGNLALLWLARTRPVRSIPLPGWAVWTAVTAPVAIVVAMTIASKSAANRPAEQTLPSESYEQEPNERGAVPPPSGPDSQVSDER